MEHDAWRQRWTEGRIGFHEGAPNAFLAQHAGLLAGRDRVLVPLCGKTEDLAFLAARGHQVVGVELVEDAVRAFFSEHALAPDVTRDGVFVTYSHGPITVLAGDVFDVARDRTGTIDAIYDRAALIALPPELRRRYAAHLRSLVAPGALMLVVTLEYPQDRMAGPPFAVDEAELRELYRGCTIDLLEQRPAGGRLREAGIDGTERCFAITMR